MENVSITKENLKLAISALDELSSNLSVKLCERNLTNDAREHYLYKLEKTKTLSKDLFNQLISL